MMLAFKYLTTEIIESDHVILNAERVEKIENGLSHHWRSAEVVLTILWSLMLLEVCIAHNWSYEARSIFDSCCICLWIWTVEGKMEVEASCATFVA